MSELFIVAVYFTIQPVLYQFFTPISLYTCSRLSSTILDYFSSDSQYSAKNKNSSHLIVLVDTLSEITALYFVVMNEMFIQFYPIVLIDVCLLLTVCSLQLKSVNS